MNLTNKEQVIEWLDDFIEENKELKRKPFISLERIVEMKETLEGGYFRFVYDIEQSLLKTIYPDSSFKIEKAYLEFDNFLYRIYGENNNLKGITSVKSIEFL